MTVDYIHTSFHFKEILHFLAHHMSLHKLFGTIALFIAPLPG